MRKTPRCVDIIIGMQYGSEAKGKLISVLAEGQNNTYSALVRTGASNAAHSIVYQGKKHAFHMIPCGALHNPDAKLVLGAGAQIDLDHLKKEIELLKSLDRWYDHKGEPRLLIDPNATIVEKIDQIAENGGRMPDCGDLYFHPRDCEVHNGTEVELVFGMESVTGTKEAGTCVGCPKLPKDSAWLKLGSTTHGAGANMIRKIARGTKMVNLAGYQNTPPVLLAKDCEFTQPFLGDTVEFLNKLVDSYRAVMIEGTQGAMLSMHHGTYPKTTSRDTNVSNWCAEAGISPLAVRDVFGVARTFPIRVAGDSGPTSGVEITWEDVTAFAESPEEVVEITTATKRKRRVFMFGHDDFRKALNLNRPTVLMLTFIDYLDYNDRNKTKWEDLSPKTRDWITILESRHGIFFKYLSTGPNVEHTIVRSE